jgi:hypothetical protein
MEELIMEERKNKGAGKYDPIFCYGFQWLYKRSDKTHQASLLKKFSDPAIFKKEDIDKLKNEIDADEKAYREMFHGLMSTERNRDNDTCRRIP